MAPVSALKRSSLIAVCAVVGGLLAVGGVSAALPPPAAPAPAVALNGIPAAPDPLIEHTELIHIARDATKAQAVLAQQQAEAKAAQEAADAKKAADEAAAAQAAAAQAAAQAAQEAAQQQAAAQAQQAQAAAAPAPAAPKPAAPAAPTAYIPVVGSGGQAAVDACQGPIHFTPVTVSVSIDEHDFCGGWARMSWIQPGTVVTVQGYGTFTAFQRMVVSQGASEYVVGNFAGGYPPIFLQTCIPGTNQMLLIGLH